MKLSTALTRQRTEPIGCSRRKSSHRRITQRNLNAECLESRQLLAANVLASVNAELKTEGSLRDLILTVTTPNAPAGTPAALMIHVDPLPGSSVNPAAVTIQQDNTDRTAVLPQISINDAQGKGSLTVVEVPAGKYIVRVGDEGTAKGGFKTSVSMVGDTLPAIGVISSFEEIYASAAMTQAMGTGNFVTNTYYQSQGIDMSRNLYDSGLDADNDGRITSRDLRYVTTNARVGSVTVNLISDATAPVIEAQLIEDTGSSKVDRITTKPEIRGKITDESKITVFEGRIGTDRPFVDLLSKLTDESFELDRNQLDLLSGGKLSEGPVILELKATDDAGNSVSPPFRFTFTFIDGNSAPTVQDIPQREAIEDSVFNLNLSEFFSDPDTGDVLSYTAGTLPPWLQLNQSTGLLSGTPRNEHVGSSTVTITATDSQGLSVSKTFTIVVTNVNDPPIVQNIPDQQANRNTEFSLNIGDFVSDPDVGDTVTISVNLVDRFDNQGNPVNLRPLPNWLTFNDTTKILQGTPPATEAGNAYTIGVLAVDNAGATANDTFQLSIVGNRRPVGSPIPDQTVAAGSTLNFNISSFFSDPDGDPLTFNLLRVDPAGPLPSWITFNEATGQISGTPTTGDIGVFHFNAIARDASAPTEVPQRFSITVTSLAEVRFTLKTLDASNNIITSVAPGGTFFLVGFVQDVSPNPTGVFSAFLDVTFNAGLAAPSTGATIVHSSTYGAGTSGVITAGLLDEVGGTDGITPLGGAEFELFRLQFTAGTTAGSVTFSGDPAEDKVLHPVLRFGGSTNVPDDRQEFRSTTITIGPTGAPLSARVQHYGTNMQNPFDVNADGLVTPLDALLVINQLSNREMLVSGFVDVNADGNVSPLDALMVINQMRSAPRAAMSAQAAVDEDEDRRPADAVYDAVFASGEL